MNVPDLVLSRRLPLTLDVDRLQGDLHRLTTGWQDHFADNYYTGSWNVLPLLTADGCEHDLVTPWEREFEPTPFLLSCAYFQESPGAVLRAPCCGFVCTASSREP